MTMQGSNTVRKLRTGLDGAFVQVGATRDGLDPYLDCARARGLTTVLVETPAYLRWRRQLGRRPFEVEIPVPEPHDPRQVAAALRDAGLARPALVLAGFERYAAGAFALAAALRVPPWPHAGRAFAPPDKSQQRAALARHAPDVLQPRHVHVASPDRAALGHALAGLAFPQVVKPVDGAGGLGVYLVADAEARERAARHVTAGANYGGGAFAGLLVEERVQGTEYSMQGIAWDGEAHLLSYCEKVVMPEEGLPDEDRPDEDRPGDGLPGGGMRHDGGPGGGVRGFRESGHIAVPGALAPPELRRLAQRCVSATGYRRGPFHVDAISDGRGPNFLEMGFRLSGGGLVALIERVTGLSWAELTFAALLDGRRPPQAATAAGGRNAIGQLVVTDPRQLARARALAAVHPGIRVDLAVPPPGERDLLPDDAASLAADRRRHAVVRARVLLEDDRADRIRGWLRHCAGAGHGEHHGDHHGEHHEEHDARAQGPARAPAHDPAHAHAPVPVPPVPERDD